MVNETTNVLRYSKLLSVSCNKTTIRNSLNLTIEICCSDFVQKSLLLVTKMIKRKRKIYTQINKLNSK